MIDNPLRNHLQPWKQEDKKELENLFKSGKKLNEIASIMGRTYNAISSQLEQQKLVINIRGKVYKLEFYADLIGLNKGN